MPSTGVWDDLAAIAVVPLLVWLLACGFGLLVERITKTTLPNALLVAVGFCLSVIVALGLYTTGAGDEIVLPAMALLALAGFALAGRARFGRLNAGWPLLAALATYLLFNASVIMTGHWTFTGYNVENDSAYELLLVAHLQAHGTQELAANTPLSTAHTALVSYLSTGYPLGSQSLLAVVSGLLGVSAAVAWQAFISTMAAISALACSTLSGRTMDRRLAALTGFLAVSAALTYQYALQGSIKEIAMVAAVLCALAITRHAVIALRPSVAVATAAIPLAAILAIYSAAGLPYVGAVAGAGVMAIPLVRHVRLAQLRLALRPAAIGVASLLVLSVPALPTFDTFLNVANAGYVGSQATAPSLGPLVRALPLSEISGVWLFGDYRFAVPAGAAAVLTVAATVLIFALIAPGVLRTIAAREPGPLMALVTMALVLAVMLPRTIPYAQAKLLMIASPVVILIAAQGLTGFRSWDWRALCALAASGLGVAVLASDALAYHQFPVAPANRMIALEQVGRRLGDKGPVLDSEFEQFAKYFALPARIVDGPDAPTPEELALLTPTVEYDHSFDLDEEQLPFVESFPYILVRRGPTSSRPPSNYGPIYENAFYTLWQRTSTPAVHAHMPLGEGISSGGVIGCRALAAFVRHDPPGSRLAVARSAPTYGFRLANVTARAPGWAPMANGEYSTSTPGEASSSINVSSPGSFKVWVQGDMPRSITVTLNGRALGSAGGSDTPGGWLSAGSVNLAAGSYTLAVKRGGGGIGPGNGNMQASLGAVALVSETPRQEPVVTSPLASWRSLCHTRADWVELIG